MKDIQKHSQPNPRWYTCPLRRQASCLCFYLGPSALQATGPPKVDTDPSKGGIEDKAPNPPTCCGLHTKGLRHNLNAKARILKCKDIREKR